MSSVFGLAFAHAHWNNPPATIGSIVAPGINIPMPTAVGDGSTLPHRGSSTEMIAPAATAMSIAVKQPSGSLLNPAFNSSANPAHLTEIGDERPLPPMPYFRRSAGYTNATASAPMGTETN